MILSLMYEINSLLHISWKAFILRFNGSDLSLLEKCSKACQGVLRPTSYILFNRQISSVWLGCKPNWRTNQTALNTTCLSIKLKHPREDMEVLKCWASLWKKRTEGGKRQMETLSRPCTCNWVGWFFIGVKRCWSFTDLRTDKEWKTLKLGFMAVGLKQTIFLLSFAMSYIFKWDFELRLEVLGFISNEENVISGQLKWFVSSVLKIFSIWGHLTPNELKITWNCQETKQLNVDLALIPPKPIDINAKFISKRNIQALPAHMGQLGGLAEPGSHLHLLSWRQWGTAARRLALTSSHLPLFQCYLVFQLLPLDLLSLLASIQLLSFLPFPLLYFLPSIPLHSWSILQKSAAVWKPLFSAVVLGTHLTPTCLNRKRQRLAVCLL